MSFSSNPCRWPNVRGKKEIHPHGELGQDTRQRFDLLGRGQVGGHGATQVVAVEVELGRGEPDGALFHRLPHHGGHGLHLGRGGGPFGGRLAHDAPPHGGVAHVGGGVDPDLPVEPGQEVPHRAAGEGDAGGQGLVGHPFDPGQHFAQPAHVVGRGRGDREPAVPEDDGGDPVPTGR